MAETVTLQIPEALYQRLAIASNTYSQNTHHYSSHAHYKTSELPQNP
jgi:uncharacterized membrane protein